jgi:hypothetical protein
MPAAAPGILERALLQGKSGFGNFVQNRWFPGFYLPAYGKKCA